MMYLHKQAKRENAMDDLTVKGIDFKVDINLDLGVIKVLDPTDMSVAFAEINKKTAEGFFTLYNPDGQGEEFTLAQEFYDNMVNGDGVETAKWLCGIAFMQPVINHKPTESNFDFNEEPPF